LISRIYLANHVATATYNHSATASYNNKVQGDEALRSFGVK